MAARIAIAPSPNSVPISAIRPEALEATIAASNHCTSGIEEPPLVMGESHRSEVQLTRRQAWRGPT